MNHFYRSIPGWFSFQDVYADAVREAPADRESIFVEIGCWKGKSTAFLAVEAINSGKPIKICAVDHWLGSDEPAHHADPDVKNGTLFERFVANMMPVRRHVEVMRMASVDAASVFAGRLADLVMLDGDHSYDGVRADLSAWLPRMRPGGVVAGDDWNWSGVNQAVIERFVVEQDPDAPIPTRSMPPPVLRDCSSFEILGEGKGRHWRVRL